MRRACRAPAALAALFFLGVTGFARPAAAQDSVTPEGAAVDAGGGAAAETSADAAVDTAAPELALSFSPADPKAMEAAREAGHLRSDTPSAGVSTYVATMVRRVQLWAYRLIISGLSRVTNLRTLLKFTGQLLVWGAILAVLLGAAAFLSRFFGRRRKSAPGSARVETTVGTAPTLGSAAWRAEVESRLGAGDVPGALEALWWWLARSLAADRADPTWTSRELLRHAPIERAQRRQLLPAVRRLDHFTYGPLPAQAGEVRSFVADLDAVLESVLETVHRAAATSSSGEGSP